MSDASSLGATAAESPDLAPLRTPSMTRFDLAICVDDVPAGNVDVAAIERVHATAWVSCRLTTSPHGPGRVL